MKKLFFGIVAALLMNAVAWAALQVRGNYQGHGFTVAFEPQQTATVYWDDNATGFTGYFNPNPNPAPRCFCDVYEADGRRVDIERGVGGEYMQAYYSKR